MRLLHVGDDVYQVVYANVELTGPFSEDKLKEQGLTILRNKIDGAVLVGEKIEEAVFEDIVIKKLPTNRQAKNYKKKKESSLDILA